jgi:UDP-N-acetylglucosamine 2-epimerase (non-hydrolysing)
MKKALVCFGTRPEAIKLAPLVRVFSRRSSFNTRVCVTAQHREMLDQVLELFEITPDHDLNLMSPGQTLEELTGAVVRSIAEVLHKEKPDFVVVQGDTTTTFAVALAAFYQRIEVVHVEAGLRTKQKYAPFPEEMNRQMTSCLTDWHFAPTKRARDALLLENFPEERVFTVGNTVIDALLEVTQKAHQRDAEIRSHLAMIDTNKKILLITGHRRENFGEGFRNICGAIRRIAQANPEMEIVYPVHLNPNVQEPVRSILAGLHNVHLIGPQDYLTFVWILDKSTIVLTDSGGVQEEAPSLGKPVLVMREVTERPEAVEAGVAKLVGTDPELIVSSVQTLIDDPAEYDRMSRAQNPYVDGTSSVQIADILETEFAPATRAAMKPQAQQ